MVAEAEIPLTSSTLRELWQEDCRLLIPEFVLYDSSEMDREIMRVRDEMAMRGCSDLEVIVEIIRNVQEDLTRVPGAWWWISACLEILPDKYCHPWLEVAWWAYQRSRGKRETNTFWGSASCGKTQTFAAIALTNLVVWHGLSHVYVTSPYKNSGADKIWKPLRRAATCWMTPEGRPAWADELGLTIKCINEEITVTNSGGHTSTAAFVSLETEAQIQGKKREGPIPPGIRDADISKVGVVLLIGDELVINPSACAKFLSGEGNLVSNDNAMGMLACNPLPQLIKHANALELSAPKEVSIDTLNEHKDFTWKTNRGRLYRFCMANSPNRHRHRPVFRDLINAEQAEAQTIRGESNYAAQVAAWGWGTGLGNGGVVTLDAINTPAWQPQPVWAQPPSRALFCDLAFGGRDPAGYTAMEWGVALINGVHTDIIAGLEQEKIDVQRSWTPKQEDLDEFRRLAQARGGRMPDMVAGVEVGANYHMTFQVLRIAAKLGIPKGRVSFDSSLRPDVTLMMISALGHVPWFYSGTRPIKEEELNWPLYPPVLKPDGLAQRWSDCHTQVIGCAWRLAEHLIARGHVRRLEKLKKGTQELISRMWLPSSGGVKTDLEGKKKLSVSPMWGETLSLCAVFVTRFCGALPKLNTEKPYSDGGGAAWENHDVFRLQSRRVNPAIWR